MRSPAVAFLLALVAAAPASAATPTFSSPRSIDLTQTSLVDLTDATAFVIGDAEDDGRDDLGVFAPLGPGVFTGTAGMGFASGSPFQPLGPLPPFTAPAPNGAFTDVTDDGLDDLVGFDMAGGGIAVVGLSDGLGSIGGCSCGFFAFGDVSTDAGLGSDPQGSRIAVADLDLDGDKDLLVTDNAHSQQLYVYTGNGADWSSAAPSYAGTISVGAVMQDLVVADLEGSSRPEVALMLDAGEARVLADPAGDLSFSSSLTLTPGDASADQRLAAGDVTGDGRPDLLASDTGGDRVVVYRGGTGFGSSPQPSPPVTGASNLAVGDLNADGRAEIVTGSSGGSSALTLLEGSSTGATTSLGTIGSGSTPTEALATGDFDGDGRDDIAAATDDYLDLYLNRSLPAIGAGAPGDFGSQAVGTMGAARTVSVTNTGAAPLKVTSVRSSSDDFVVSGESCVGETIAAGATCAARVRFAPTETGARSGTLSIAGNAASAGTAALTGTGTAAPSGGSSTNGTTGPAGPQGPQGIPGPQGEPGYPVSRGHARCRVRAQQRIQCVVYNAKTVPWRFSGIKDGKLGNRIIRPGRYRLTVIHVMSSGRLRVFRRFVRVR
jgi:hypothetical protein